MSFPKPPSRELRAWDENAEHAAMCAQVMIMGGALQPDFDRREFDRNIKRQPGRHLNQGDAMRHMMAALPRLRMTVYDRHQASVFLDPSRLGRALLTDGWDRNRVEGYLKSKRYERACSDLRAMLNVGRILGEYRYKEVVTTAPQRGCLQALTRGGVVSTVDASAGVRILLIPSRTAGKLSVYSPGGGMEKPATPQELTKRGAINLNFYGGTAYFMS